MPKVGGKKFPYSEEGKKLAFAEMKKTQTSKKASKKTPKKTSKKTPKKRPA